MLRNLDSKLKVKVTRIKQRKKEKERITYERERERERERHHKQNKRLKDFFFPCNFLSVLLKSCCSLKKQKMITKKFLITFKCKYKALCESCS